MKTAMINFAAEVRAMLAAGSTLAEISKESYRRREAGEQVPYLGILNADENGSTIELDARPTKKQGSLSQFFCEKAPGSVLPRYTFRVTASGVQFMERLGRGKDNVRNVEA